jgi:hypothetical protein
VWPVVVEAGRGRGQNAVLGQARGWARRRAQTQGRGTPGASLKIRSQIINITIGLTVELSEKER